MSQPAPFTPDDKDRIAQMMRDGLSASQIGAQVGRSRSAICGLVHRNPALKEIGLRGEQTGGRPPKIVGTPHAMSIKASRKQGGIKGGKTAKILPQNLVAKKAARATDPKLVHRAAAAKDARMVPLEALEPRDGCRFIFGEPSSALYYGLPGFPWCEGHRRLVYTPAIVRRAAA